MRDALLRVEFSIQTCLACSVPELDPGRPCRSELRVTSSERVGCRFLSLRHFGSLSLSLSLSSGFGKNPKSLTGPASLIVVEAA